MIKENFLLNNFSLRSNQFYSNLKKTKKIFNLFKSDFENFEFPVLQSFEENYPFDFSKNTVKKFSKFENIVIVGMGGSILGIKCIYSFFKKKIKKKVFFFDNLDENFYFKFKGFKNACFIIISKSGNTLETITNLNILFSKSNLKNKLIFITELKDSGLMEAANKFNADIIEHKKFIGGRYSVLSETGMFPAALMGLKINKFKRIKKIIKNKNFISSLIQSVASIYTLNAKGMRNSVILSYDSNLNDLGYWYQQLVGESLGKKGKGIMPILSKNPKDHHSLFQLYLDGPKDKFFTFFTSSNTNNSNKISEKIIPSKMSFLKNKKLSSIIDAQCKATKKIFKLKDIPFRHFIFNKKKEEELGIIFTFFVLETILLSKLMNVDPFDQPGVEEIKIETKKILLR